MIAISAPDAPADTRSTSSTERMSRPEPSPASVRVALVAVVVAFLALGALIPIAQETPIVDEPIFASSAFEFANSGAIRISEFSAPTAVFDTVWGGLFAKLLGETYGSLRFSTLVLTALSALFVFVLCREAGASPRLALLGTVAYLGAPLALNLSFTFQTGPHAVALVVIAAAALVRSLRVGSIPMMAVASLVTAMAYLSRPQTLVLILAGLVAIWTAHGLERKWASTAALLAMPIAVVALHTIWVSSVGPSYLAELSLTSATGRSLYAYTNLMVQAVVYTPIYAGLFALPLLPLLIPTRAGTWRRGRVVLGVLAALTLGLFLSGKSIFSGQAWLARTGFGGVDRSFLGNRPDLLHPAAWALVAILLMVSCFSLIVRLMERSGDPPNPVHRFLVLAGIGFAFAALAASLALQGMVFDRYFLLMAPFVIALACGLARDTPRRFGASWAAALILATIGAIGTFDAFVVYREADRLAEEVIATGVSPLEFDGGASWSAATFGLGEDDPAAAIDRSGPYWIKFYAVESDPYIGLALSPLPGYEIVERRPLPSILHVRDTYLYVVRRDPAQKYFIRARDF